MLLNREGILFVGSPFLNSVVYIISVVLNIVFYVTQTSASIAFPVFILLLIPLRFNLLPRLDPFFSQEFIDTIDQPLILAADDVEREVNIETSNHEMQPASADGSNVVEAAADVSVAVSSPPRTPPALPDLLASFRTPPPPHVSHPSGLHHRTASA